jgi:hypothetical protein
MRFMNEKLPHAKGAFLQLQMKSVIRFYHGKKANTTMPDDYADAHKKIRDYLCKVCWSELRIAFGPNRSYIVRCANIATHIGFVSRDIVNQERIKSSMELVTAKNNLAEVMGIAEPKKSVEELLKILGG